jgi:23S rRNA (uridine2552-2'-O)-methyltransferase
LKKGQRVLDLGASPGSWTLYAAEKVGPSGRVLGIDLKDPEVTLPAQAEIRTLDAFQVDPESLGGPFDLVISDMAPKTSGQRHADQYRSYELVMRALDLTKTVLEPGGTFVAKIFQGAEFEDARTALREVFGKVRIIRPEATRDESYEVFLVGLGFRPTSS